ncbi:DNA glycosylase [Phycomyces blakesleeanus]|uniref:DNA-(apurinic or apyrimidinic site) lyase n=1 Tax=Phycomyces blakesleeanus TaxID=4837 RepID=A0ABR3BEJ1_PHYBL
MTPPIRASSLLKWKDLNVSPNELRLDTLRCGQSFRWKQNNGLWSCVLNGRLVVLKETDTSVMYGEWEEDKTIEKDLRDYFQLDKVSLSECYERWSGIDPNFKVKAMGLKGIRILRQDPWENLVSFICSSNNNISRISQMVNKLCVQFGPKVATMDGEGFYAFPPLDKLIGTQDQLRELGFGYRARYIAQTAAQIAAEHPDQKEQWLHTLRNVSFDEAKTALMRYPGVGPKVADCVCLMSLDQHEAIPVDTHVWQIAMRDYRFNLTGVSKTKTLTPALYKAIATNFRDLFGSYSGWAHSVSQL